MSNITLLPEAIFNKIAAGEVVERPASVLKELMENALDAGTTKIMAQVLKGGAELISVTDSGSGMDGDDALLCFEAHATSKIRQETDLFAIRTMGFRGEALPSIASVSRITLRTRQKASTEGTEVVIHGGKLISSKPVGCAPGTEIHVRDLFFNTPARKKFLRSRSTEEHHICELFTNIALAHPEVSFELKLDQRTFLSSPGAKDCTLRIRDLFGKEYADALLPLHGSHGNIAVSGFIAKRSYTKPTRLEQRVFVNGRPVESQAVYRGIREGCGPVLDKGRYQPCILFITLDPSQVDVNVHPAKREVRFSHEYELSCVIRDAVAEALREDVSQLTNFICQDPISPESPAREEPLSPAPFLMTVPPPPPPADDGFHDLSELDKVLAKAHLDYVPAAAALPLVRASELPGFQEAEKKAILPEEKKEEAVPEKKNPSLGLRIIGILNRTYILAERSDGLILIDQHAAHERILFEKFLKSGDNMNSQQLLIPITLELTRGEAAFLSRHHELIEKLGFEAESFGQNTVKLNAIPGALSQSNAGTLFRETLSNALEECSPGRIPNYEKLAMSACKAAVKANDALTMEEAIALLHQLSDCDLPFACPHGRPTILNISMQEIERRFGRR